MGRPKPQKKQITAIDIEIMQFQYDGRKLVKTIEGYERQISELSDRLAQCQVKLAKVERDIKNRGGKIPWDEVHEENLLTN